MRCFRPFSFLAALSLLLVSTAVAEVIRVELLSQEPYASGRLFGPVGAYQILRGKVHFEVDPLLPANAGIADLRLATRNAAGRVEFSSDFVVLRPAHALRDSVLLEVINRGSSEEHLFLSAHRGEIDLPAMKNQKYTDAFLFEQGFTLAYLGWETDPGGGSMHLDAPVVNVHGPVRAEGLTDADSRNGKPIVLHALRSPSGECPTDSAQPKQKLLIQRSFTDPGTEIPRDDWTFTTAPNSESGRPSCAVTVKRGLPLPSPDGGPMVEIIYDGGATPVAGLSFAAFRDFATYLKAHGTDDPLRLTNAGHVLGFGYSQSARFLRTFLRNGSNAGEHGGRAFDGLFIASAGAGGGSFNHRYAMPGNAGNSVLVDLHPVDLFPFSDTDEMDPVTGQRGSVLAPAHAAHVMPKIVTTLSSTEYWARYASLTTITINGSKDLPLDPDERLYFIAGTPHAPGSVQPRRKVGSTEYANLVNFEVPTSVFRALLLDLDDWVVKGTPAPPSTYPHRAQLVERAAVRFPKIPGSPFPTYMPRNWRMDFGPRFRTQGVIDREPPKLGAEYTILVPQVDANGNDQGGVNLPAIAVPLGTYTGWNQELPAVPAFEYLGGLRGSFFAFPKTAQARQSSGDSRPSVEERYLSEDDFLKQTRAAANTLVARRLMLGRDVEDELSQARTLWEYVQTTP